MMDLRGVKHYLDNPLRLVLLLFATVAFLVFLAAIVFSHRSLSHKLGIGGVAVLAYGIFFAIDAFADCS